MPEQVTHNLEGAALEQYKRWSRKRQASAMINKLILQWISKTSDMALLHPGDRRTSITGDELMWTGERWEVVE